MRQKLIPQPSDSEIYEEYIKDKEIDGIMNQISPRVFETIAAKTVLVLFEGNYSDVIKAGEHYIPLKKDGSNLEEVLQLLQDDAYIDAMAERAYRDIITSGKYSYKNFIELVDKEIAKALAREKCATTNTVDCMSPHDYSRGSLSITTSPIRASPPQFQLPTGNTLFLMPICITLWSKLPEKIKIFITPHLKRLLRIK